MGLNISLIQKWSYFVIIISELMPWLWSKSDVLTN